MNYQFLLLMRYRYNYIKKLMTILQLIINYKYLVIIFKKMNLIIIKEERIIEERNT